MTVILDPATLEAAAKVADARAGTPVHAPENFDDWARHGERMSAIRIAAAIRALAHTEKK